MDQRGWIKTILYKKLSGRINDGEFINYIQMHHLRSIRIKLWPTSLELIQVMRTKNGTISSEVFEIVHDHGHKQIQELEHKR